MARNEIKGKVLLNVEPYTNLQSEDVVLEKGEMIISTVSGSEDTVVMIKVGDGVSSFNSLEWVSALAADVFPWAKAEQKPIYTAAEINFSDGESLQQKFNEKEIGGLQIVDY